jgi:MFS superfamily sulfate permease-like transporter
MTEALVDSYGGFDRFEYASIVLITATMTAYGMTAGLGAGVVLAAVTFTSQTSKYIFPIRGQMTAATVRSTARRSEAFYDILHVNSKRIHIIQLQGNIFFGNATRLSSEIADLLLQSRGEIWCLLLDFTLVLTIDSSAVETIASIPALCYPFDVKVCCVSRSPSVLNCDSCLLFCFILWCGLLFVIYARYALLEGPIWGFLVRPIYREDSRWPLWIIPLTAASSALARALQSSPPAAHRLTPPWRRNSSTSKKKCI